MSALAIFRHLTQQQSSAIPQGLSLESRGTWGADQLQTFFSQGNVSPSVSLWALQGTVLK
jgi:hypothetical protein